MPESVYNKVEIKNGSAVESVRLMKKITALLLALALLLLPALASCTAPDPDADLTIRVAGMKGPTSMGLVKLAEDNAAGTSQNKYDIKTDYKAADEILPKLVRGELDMAALPANVAATAFNNNNEFISVLAINTLGVVNIVEKGTTINGFSDLVGKKIYAVGKGTTPQYALEYLLAQNGMQLSDLTIEWKSEASEILPLLKTEAGAVAMIPQPFVTAACRQVEGLRVAINFNEKWTALNNGTQFVTGVLVARRDFIEEHPTAVAKFLDEYRASITYANENSAAAGELVKKYGIVDFAAPIAAAAIPNCNLAFLGGADMKAALSGYLSTLYAANPAAVGGKMPADSFYYVS